MTETELAEKQRVIDAVAALVAEVPVRETLSTHHERCWMFHLDCLALKISEIIGAEAPQLVPIGTQYRGVYPAQLVEETDFESRTGSLDDVAGIVRFVNSRAAAAGITHRGHVEARETFADPWHEIEMPARDEEPS